jgi:hypothetical protein
MSKVASDRDSYVKIIWESVKGGKNNTNFQKDLFWRMNWVEVIG